MADLLRTAAAARLLRQSVHGVPIARRTRILRPPMGFIHHSSSGEEQTQDLIREAPEGHILGIAPTGSGKGRGLLIPGLLDYEGSIVTIDVKGEQYCVTARYRQEVLGHEICVVDAFDALKRLIGALLIGRLCTLDPVRLQLRDDSDLGDDCMAVAEQIAGPAAASLQDPFWRHNAILLIAALFGWHAIRHTLAMPPTQQAPADASGILADTIEMLSDPDLAYRLAVILDTTGSDPRFPKFVHRGFAHFLAHEAEKVRTSVRSEAVSLLHVFCSDRMLAATAATTLPVQKLLDGEPVTVYLVIPPDRLQSHAPYLRTMVSSLMAVLSRRTRRVSDLPTLFLLDEAAQLGPMTEIRTAVTLLRGYGVKVGLYYQSLAQLRGIWPNDWETIVENCSTLACFGVPTMAAARHLAEHLGGPSPEELAALPRGAMAIRRAGHPTEIAACLDYLNDPEFQGRADPNPYYQKPAEREFERSGSNRRRARSRE